MPRAGSRASGNATGLPPNAGAPPFSGANHVTQPRAHVVLVGRLPMPRGQLVCLVPRSDDQPCTPLQDSYLRGATRQRERGVEPMTGDSLPGRRERGEAIRWPRGIDLDARVLGGNRRLPRGFVRFLSVEPQGPAPTAARARAGPRDPCYGPAPTSPVWVWRRPFRPGLPRKAKLAVGHGSRLSAAQPSAVFGVGHRRRRGVAADHGEKRSKACNAQEASGEYVNERAHRPQALVAERRRGCAS